MTPALVAHADWGSAPGKRWLARAVRDGGRYIALPPEPVTDPPALLAGLAGSGPALVGFDLPIGVPAAYARRAGISDFPAALRAFGAGDWSAFYDPAERPEQISPRRPFYPARPGGAALSHLIAGVGVAGKNDLLRRCDFAHAGRRAAAVMFWTMGPQQVGKAAISGWRDVIVPALRAGLDVALYPFCGDLWAALAARRLVVVETYPTEYYARLGLRLRGSKRQQGVRAAQAAALLAWAETAGVALDAALRAQIGDGFGGRADGEDRFDALVGLFGMLNVALRQQPPGAPEDEPVRRVEGWIFGQTAENDSLAENKGKPRAVSGAASRREPEETTP